MLCSMKSKIPVWLKGGLILTCINFLLWLGFLLWASRGSSHGAGFAVLGGIYYGLLSLIPVFVIGVAIGATIDKLLSTKNKPHTKGLYVGLAISIIFSIAALIVNIFLKYTNPYRLSEHLVGATGLSYYLAFSPAELIFTLAFIALSGGIGYLVGKIKEQKKVR